MDGRGWKIGLIAGSVLMIVLMAIHPSGPGSLHHGQGGGPHLLLDLSTIVHSGAIIGKVLVMFGALGLAARLGFGKPAVLLGTVCLATAAVALVIAGSLNGFVAPKLMMALQQHKLTMDQVLPVSSFSWWLNQTLANVHLGAASAAVLLWSLAWPDRKPLALVLRGAGVLMGLALPVLFFWGPFKMDVTGAALQAALLYGWLIAAALLAPPAKA